MGYRIKEKPEPPKPRRTMQDTTTESTVYVQNGTTAYLAIPCWYLEVEPPKRAHYHSRQHHDHVGWPSPNHKDHICQSWDFAHSCCSFDKHKHECDHCERYLDMDRLIPIHMLQEGYTDIEIAMIDAPDGLKVSGYIDEKKDWIVRILFDAKCEDALEDKLVVRFSVFANGDLGNRPVSDIVADGILEILPGPFIPEEIEDDSQEA